MTHTLAATYTPAQIIFHRGDADPATNYVFDSIRVSNHRLATINTNINAVHERFTTDYEQNSLLRFDLSNSDLGAINETNLHNFNDELNRLNTKDYIRINGQPIGDDTLFLNSDKFFNHGISKGTYAVRRSGNQTGCWYKDGGTKVFTDDLTIYEVEIQSGCQFPKYGTLMGTDLIESCYVTTRDYVFIWFENEFHLEDDFTYPQYVNCDITNISITDKGGANKSLNFDIPQFDWPTIGSIENLDVRTYSPCKNLQQRILFVDKDGVQYEIVSQERFINLWGLGVDKAMFSVRMPNINVNDIEIIKIFAKAEFPSYEEFQGLSHKRFRLSQTTTYYSSLDGHLYRGSNLTASQYAVSFYDAMGEVCSTPSENFDQMQLRLSKKFGAFEKIFDLEMDATTQNEILTSTSPEVTAMLQRYAFICNKYGLTNFMDYAPASGGSPSPLNLYHSNPDYYLAFVALMALTTTMFIIVYDRKKRARK